MVNSANPVFFAPTFVQSTASPVGTVMATQNRFSIQSMTFILIIKNKWNERYLFYFIASLPLRRTTLNSTFIFIRRLDNGTVVRQIDCKYSPDVYFQNTTLIFFVPNPPWILGVTYYITMSQGVATAAYLFCGTEAGGFTGKSFSKLHLTDQSNFLSKDNGIWRFTIWNPAASSTLTPSTTTTTATVPTVTTRVCIVELIC